MYRTALAATAAVLAVGVASAQVIDELTIAESAQHPVPAQNISGDTGYNVLIDHTHQCSFWGMWRFADLLRRSGYRVAGSHALISEVLDTGNLVRVRVPVKTAEAQYHPFGQFPYSV